MERRRLGLFLLALVVPFVVLRAWLAVWPNADFNVGAYNLHHLFTGVLLVVLGGVPLALGIGKGRLLDGAVLLFGTGLSLVLDEWVYLIVTDGSNASYLLPVSFWGGVLLIGLTAGYALLLPAFGRRPKKITDDG
jgi:hypothetical protein